MTDIWLLAFVALIAMSIGFGAGLLTQAQLDRDEIARQEPVDDDDEDEGNWLNEGLLLTRDAE